MACILKTVLATCLLVFILMEGSKPVLAGKKNKYNKLLKRVQALEDSMAKLGECKGNVYNSVLRDTGKLCK